MSDPSFISDEFGSLDDMGELEGAESPNQRNFILLIGGMFAALIVAVIVMVVVFSGRSSTKSAIELTNDEVIKTNAAVKTIVSQTETAMVEDVTAQAIAQAESAAQQAASATAAAAAGTAAVEETRDAQPTPTLTVTPTPVIAATSAAPTTEGEGNGEVTPGEPSAVAQVEGTTSSSLPARTNTLMPARPGASSVPDTGFGLSAVLLAAALVIVLFVVRRLRMAT